MTIKHVSSALLFILVLTIGFSIYAMANTCSEGSCAPYPIAFNTCKVWCRSNDHGGCDSVDWISGSCSGSDCINTWYFTCQDQYTTYQQDAGFPCYGCGV